MSHTLIYIPSYFDYVRLRNYFKKEDLSYMPICEYTDKAGISRARQFFLKGRKQFLIFTERFHFYKRSAGWALRPNYLAGRGSLWWFGGGDPGWFMVRKGNVAKIVSFLPGLLPNPNWPQCAPWAAPHHWPTFSIWATVSHCHGYRAFCTGGPSLRNSSAAFALCGMHDGRLCDQ